MLFQFKERKLTHVWFRNSNVESDDQGIFRTEDKAFIDFLQNNINYDEIEMVKEIVEVPKTVSKKKESVKSEVKKTDVKAT